MNLIYKSNIYLFSCITILSIGLIYLTQNYLLTSKIYYQSLHEQLSINQIDRILETQTKYEFLGYSFMLLINLIKYLIITLIVQAGIFLWGYKINFSQILKVVIIAEFVFIIPIILKFIWFYFFKQDYNLNEFQVFYPLSILNLIQVQSIPKLWIYPLQLLNVFELIYWFLLAFGISKCIQKDFDQSLRIIISSYLPALFLWVIFVMFLTVTLNPA